MNKPETTQAPQQPKDPQDQDTRKRSYEPPAILSSRIFHKVLLATPQPGIPGCDTGYP